MSSMRRTWVPPCGTLGIGVKVRTGRRSSLRPWGLGRRFWGRLVHGGLPDLAR